MVLPNPLLEIDSRSPHELRIINDSKSSIQVAISNATLVNGSAMFYEIEPGTIDKWQRSGTELVHINGGGFGRVVIAAAGPGSYIVPELQYNDPNVGYVFNSFPGEIGVKNNLGRPIEVKLTTSTGGSKMFVEIQPGTTEMWTRNGLETIFVKYASSNVLLTYLGIPGQNIQIHQESTSSAPIFPYVGTSNPDQIDVFNQQSETVFAKISNATHPIGSEQFYAIRQGQGHTWTRHGPEVIFVNGPTGTAVGTYYGTTEYAVDVNSPIAMVWKKVNVEHN